MHVNYLQSNIYEVNIRQYTPEGTFIAFKPHLDRLSKMGVDILWFMPVTPISTINRKGTLGSYYACSDYRSVNPEYGTLDDFKSVVKQAQALGMKVIIDWVANHTGWDHVWTKSNPDFYLKNGQGHFTERNGWEDVIDLNFQNQEMRQSLIECMKYWVTECGIDGFRCDMAMLVPLDFWKSAKIELEKIRSLIWLAECEDHNYFEVFDILYAWDWMHSTKHIAVHDHDKYALQNLVQKYISNTPHRKHFLYFTSNHDENSWNGTEYERYGDYARFYAVLSGLMPLGVPLVYSGQELPLVQRLKFFDKDQIPWEDLNLKLHFLYESLFKIRHKFEADLEYEFNRHTEKSEIFTLRILNDAHTLDVILIMNMSKSVQYFDIRLSNLSARYKNLLTNENIHLSGDDKMRLEGTDFRLYRSF